MNVQYVLRETVGSQRLTLYLVFTVLIYSFEKPAVLEMHG